MAKPSDTASFVLLGAAGLGVAYFLLRKAPAPQPGTVTIVPPLVPGAPTGLVTPDGAVITIPSPPGGAAPILPSPSTSNGMSILPAASSRLPARTSPAASERTLSFARGVLGPSTNASREILGPLPLALAQEIQYLYASSIDPAVFDNEASKVEALGYTELANELRAYANKLRLGLTPIFPTMTS